MRQKNSRDYARKSEPQSLGDAVKGMMKAYRLENRYAAASAVSSWERIMGKPIANRTTKVFISKGILYAQVESAALKHELNASKSRILTLFQQEFGSEIIREVRII